MSKYFHRLAQDDKMVYGVKANQADGDGVLERVLKAKFDPVWIRLK